jgi:sensor domain CHASE-containing protein
MSEALAISLDMCSNTYLPLAVVSLIEVVLAVLTIPLTRNATTATIRMQATPSATIISTNVNPNGTLPRRPLDSRRRE